MSTTTSTVNDRKSGFALPLLFFAALMLLAMILPTRERSLLPAGSGELIGFLAQSAADEQLPAPFGEKVADPVARTGSSTADRSAALLNPVLRSGGARRSIGRRGPQAGEGSSNDPAAGELLAAAPNSASLAAASDPGTSTIGDQVPGAGPDDVLTGDGGNDFDLTPQGSPPSIVPAGDIIPDGLLGALPEPGTWLMLILGFAGIGHSLRRRSQPSAVLVRRPQS
jgi:hypothetical protein